MAEQLFIQDTNSKKCFEIKRYGYSIIFEVSGSGVECHCSYEPSTTGGSSLTREELQQFLAQYKILVGVLPEAVSELLNAASTGKAVKDLLIANGIEMIPGKDGELVLVVSDALASASEDGDVKSGTIDLRNVQSFLNVEAGQHVATIIPPELGSPGKSVFGKEIPAQSGKPFTLILGMNVHRGDDPRRIYADEAGRVCVREGEISVDDVLEIEGNVDFRVGNILFKGFVEIKGDVLDGFSVKSTKGIKVLGIIGMCTIESDGDISFSGMNGQGTGVITCKGSITANYIYETSIECDGDVVVDVEIRNAQVRSLGAIRVNKKGMAGGEYIALAGIESAIIGNITSLQTHVVAGIHYRNHEELNLQFNELKQLIAQFNSGPKDPENLKEFTRKRTAITEQTLAVRSRTYDLCNPKINARESIYAGVIVTLGNLSENIVEDLKGPLSVIENTIEGGFRYLGMTPLTFKAQEIEQTFIQQMQLEQKNSNMARSWEGE